MNWVFFIAGLAVGGLLVWWVGCRMVLAEIRESARLRREAHLNYGQGYEAGHEDGVKETHYRLRKPALEVSLGGVDRAAEQLRRFQEWVDEAHEHVAILRGTGRLPVSRSATRNGSNGAPGTVKLGEDGA